MDGARDGIGDLDLLWTRTEAGKGTGQKSVLCEITVEFRRHGLVQGRGMILRFYANSRQWRIARTLREYAGCRQFPIIAAVTGLKTTR